MARNSAAISPTAHYTGMGVTMQAGAAPVRVIEASTGITA
jgi:hypothetical protein